jgi:hypothetical protein
MGGCPRANLTRIFGKSAIPTVMQAIFDGPVGTIQFQQLRGISPLRGETGDPIDDLLGTLEGMFHTSSYTENLPNSRPIPCHTRH